MRLPWMRAIASFLFSATLSAPAWANANANSAVPGTLNYVEGKVSIGEETLDSKSIGSAEVKPGQSLTTGSGKAEVLLTPGVFLRVGDNSTVTMISPGLTDTEVRIERGQAMVEVEEIHPENDIRVTVDGATARILKTGLYDFDSDAGWVRVYDGQAIVKDGDRQAKVKGGRELDFAASGQLKAEKFDKKAHEEGDLYRWSSLRSGYVAEANVDAAGMYAANGFGPWGPSWSGAGWYWDAWFDGSTLLLGDGIHVNLSHHGSQYQAAPDQLGPHGPNPFAAYIPAANSAPSSGQRSPTYGVCEYVGLRWPDDGAELAEDAVGRSTD